MSANLDSVAYDPNTRTVAQVDLNITATGITASFFGTASWAQNAISASFLLGNVSIAPSYANSLLFMGG